MIIGIVGPLCSGKSSLSDALIEKGYRRVSFAEEIRIEMRVQGIELERKAMQDLGNEMRRKNGVDYWAKRLIEKIDPKENYVVEGFRNPGEVDAFKSHFKGDFKAVCVTAPVEKRIEWMIARKKDLDSKGKEELIELEKRDRGIGEEYYGQKSDECCKMADVKIINDSTLEDLRKKVLQVIG